MNSVRVKKDKLVGHWYRRSADIGAEMAPPRFVVMHYTAGGSGAASRDYMLKSPTQKQRLLGSASKIYASAHVVVDRDGSVWQIVPFDRMARHAGRSSWKGLESLNRYSIGIEIANYGWLDRQGDGSYKRSDTPRFEAKNVTVAPMPSGKRIMGWENYPSIQLEAVERVTRALVTAYTSITEIVGHQEIAPGRKFDPGPAFPMEYFRNLIDGRGTGAVDDESGYVERPRERYMATTRLNIRGGPGLEYEKLDESPLATGTALEYLDDEGVWTKVRLVDADAVIGWVHGGYLRIV